MIRDVVENNLNVMMPYNARGAFRYHVFCALRTPRSCTLTECAHYFRSTKETDLFTELKQPACPVIYAPVHSLLDSQGRVVDCCATLSRICTR
jgi:hypothetical protein